MFFQLYIPKIKPLEHKPNLLDVLPPLLAKSLSVSERPDRWFAHTSNPDNSDVRYLENESELVVVLGYAGQIGECVNMSASSILAKLKQGRTFFSGQYMIVWHQKFSKRTNVYTTTSRTISCYYRIEDDGVWLSNRQSSIAVAGTKPDRLGLEKCYPFLRNGYIPGEQSVFNNVQLCKANSVTQFHDLDEPIVFSVSDVLDVIGTENGSDELLTDITESTLTAFTPMVNKPIKIGITGGRDSRLILASVAGVFGDSVETFTKGEPDDPDVVIGKRVSEALGLKHSVMPPAKLVDDSIVKINVVQRIRSTIINSDFNISAYDNISSVPNRYQMDNLTFGGNGGELLRSPFAYANSDINTALKTIRAHADGDQFVRNSMGAAYRDEVEQWILGQGKDSSASSLLKKFSLMYRTGRWGSASYAASYARLSQRPFYDNGLLQNMLRLKDHYATSESLYYELLYRINPNLLDIPFDKAPLNLSSSPLERYTIAARSLPSAVQWPTKKKRVSSLNWRRVLRGSLGDEILRIISDVHSSCPDFNELVDLNAIRGLLESLRPGMVDTLTAKRLWSTATMALMFDLIGNTENDRVQGSTISISLAK